jgi:maleate isomerase
MMIDPVSFTPHFDEGPGKFRIGLILLSNDYATERDFVNMRPSPDVAYFAVRIPMPPEITTESLTRTEKELGRAASLILPGGRVDAIAYSCTSASVVLGHERVQRAIQSGRPCVPCITPINAALSALETLGAKRIAVLTPYIDSINERFLQEFRNLGQDVRSFHSFKLINDLDMANLSPQSILQGAVEADVDDADAVFISCTAIRAVEVIDAIEQQIGKPVVTSIQAMFWQSLRTVGYREPIHGYGKLLSTR